MADHRPIVPNARFIVRCAACDAGFDSAERDAADALVDVMVRHDPTHARALTVTPMDYTDHPLHRQHEDRGWPAAVVVDRAALEAALARKGESHGKA